MELKGKTVLITGGAAGMGLEAAKQFLANGANVIITGRSQEKLNAAKKLYPALTAIKSDVANADDVRRLFGQIEELGGIDILYNNAGVLSNPSNLGIATEEHFEAAKYEMDINYLGVIRMTNLFIEMLKAREEGAIINTTSLLSYVPLLLEPTYSASKVALRFYTESLRKHLQILKSRVKVFELMPPLVATDMATGLGPNAISPEVVVNALIADLKKDQFTIRVGDTRAIHILSRFFPKIAFSLVNPAKNDSLLARG